MNPFAVGRTRGQWVSDTIVFGLAVILWVFFGFIAASDFPAIPAWFWVVDRALGAVACCALWWARRYPAVVGLALIVPGTLSVSAGFPAVAGVYRMASLTRPAVSVPVTVGHIAFALPYHAVFPVPGMTWLVWLIVIPLLYLLSLSVGLLTRSRRLVIDGLRETSARDRAILESRLASLRRDERERIAREMHDVLAHRISLLSVHAGALEFRTAEGGRAAGMTPREIHGAASVIRENAHLAVTELGEVLALLRDGDGAEDELGRSRPQARMDDLAELVDQAMRSGQRVELDVDAAVIAAAHDSRQRTVYRIVQEGLTNARKHAPRSPVSIAVRLSGDMVRVEVTNPVPVGVTTSEIPGAGVGLVGLRERVRLDGGRLTHGIEGGVFCLVGDIPGDRR